MLSKSFIPLSQTEVKLRVLKPRSLGRTFPQYISQMGKGTYNCIWKFFTFIANDIVSPSDALSKQDSRLFQFFFNIIIQPSILITIWC